MDEIGRTTTIELGHNMGLRVVAEGGESVEGYEILKRLGCDMAQRYFISRPLPSTEFLTWMRESRWGVRSEASAGR